MAEKITREEEVKIPSFSDENAAIVWFKERYGRYFQFETIEKYEDGSKCYFYRLIIDPETYEEITSRGMPLSGSIQDMIKYLECYQSIQIMSGGSVHIVH